MRPAWPVLWTRMMLAALLAAACPPAVALAAATNCFFIQVVDEQTGRGVPLVELSTVNKVSFWTDSAGVAAVCEPAFMGRTIYFHVRSHGYEFPADGFGYRGRALRVTPGGQTELKLKRLNIAERLYRITGEGIYRDSVLAGRRPPLREPLLNGQVFGQDTVMAIPYRGRLYWFWGDTDRASYPLGHFGTAGATSELPERGGLDPAVGVDLHYFTDASGFSRPMCAWPGPGLKWLTGPMTVRDSQGDERLVAFCETHKSLAEVRERSLVLFNDATTNFDRLILWETNALLHPDSHPFRVDVRGEPFWYFPTWAPQPCVRVRADFTYLTNATAYEAFTPLAPGARFEKAATKLDRTPDGRLRHGWKRNTAFLGHAEQRELVRAGRLQPDEGPLQMRDILTDAPFEGHGGSVNWNAFRRRWIMIAQGRPGDIWFAEADTPVGPWLYARRIVTHDRYNFYNPAHHPFFDQEGGRLIYFEGTYTAQFSAAPAPTPRYDYNQIMYRLDLADPRLALPAPVYRVRATNGTDRFLMREGVEAEDAWDRVEDIPFYAIPPGREWGDMAPFYAAPTPAGEVLCRYPPAPLVGRLKPLFFAWPPEYHAATNQLDGRWDCTGVRPGGTVVSFTLDLWLQGHSVTGLFDQTTFWRMVEVRRGSLTGTNFALEVAAENQRYAVRGVLRSNHLAGAYECLDGEERGTWEARRINLLPAEAATPALVPLHEFRRGPNDPPVYSTEPDPKLPGLFRTETPLCRVWRNPARTLVLDRHARPPAPATR